MATTTRRTKKKVLASPPLPLPGVDDVVDVRGGEENFLSVPDGAGAMALDFGSPIAARGGKGDVHSGSDDHLNMEVSPLKQQQQPKSAAKKGAGEVREQS